jgi:hypothetical protein
MKSVAFVAPLFRENTNRYLRAFAALPEVRLGVISQEPIERLEPALRDRVEAFALVRDTMEGLELARGCEELKESLGPLDGLHGALEQLQIPLAEARDACDIPGMRPEVARNFRDKTAMKAALRKAGVPVARSRAIESERDLWAFVQEVGFPVVVKPTAGLGAKATFRVADNADLRAAIAHIRPTPADPWQAEEFVTGRENTCETVSIGGVPVWRSGTHYLNPPLEVLENPWMQYCVLLPREADDPDFRSFDPIDGAALAALGMDTGLSHMEWFRRHDGAAVVSEVGARPPGAMIMPLMSRAHDCDMVAKWAELMVFGRFEPPVRKHAAGVAFFRGQGRGERVTAVRGLGQAQEEVGALVVDRQLPVVGQPRNTSYEGEGWALVVADSTAEVVHALRRLVTLVRVDL